MQILKGTQMKITADTSELYILAIMLQTYIYIIHKLFGRFHGIGALCQFRFLFVNIFIIL